MASASMTPFYLDVQVTVEREACRRATPDSAPPDHTGQADVPGSPGRRCAQALATAGVPSVVFASSSRLILRSTKKAAVGTVPARSTHSCLPTGHFALEPRSKA